MAPAAPTTIPITLSKLKRSMPMTMAKAQAKIGYVGCQSALVVPLEILIPTM